MNISLGSFSKYRWFYTSSGLLVVGGKNAVQNDELLHKIKGFRETFIILHTSEPGSPFCIILESANKVSKLDTEEAAVFTGCFSKAWKQGKMSTKVDVFNSDQIHKNNDMKSGTWGVYGNVQRITVSLGLVLVKQKDILRAVPETTAERLEDKSFPKKIKIYPGNIEKEHMFAKLELEIDESISKEKVLSAIPSGGFKIITE
ncbi:MAG: NFACT RNA binding domain-containing protein [Nanoarchaeota archaeon]